MLGFKGFDKELKCKKKQYEVGKTFTHEGEIKLCQHGLHFCEHPLDVFSYYPPAESRYAEVEADEVSEEKDSGLETKRVCKKLTVKAEITIKGLVEAAVKFVFDKATWTREEGAAQASGDQGAAQASGYHSIASGLGYQCKAKGKKGCWIVLAEREPEGKIITVKTAKVDGKKIKEDVFYTLTKGKFTVAE